jgi:hypothetical protein
LDSYHIHAKIWMLNGKQTIWLAYMTCSIFGS